MSDDISRKHFGENFHKAMKNSKLAVERAKQEFKEKYANADITKFTFNADLNKSGDVTKIFMTYMFNENEGYDIYIQHV